MVKNKETATDNKNLRTPETRNESSPPKRSRFKQFISTKKGKVTSSLVVFVALLIILFSIPVTRYGILGIFMKKHVNVSVIDSVTKKPVSEATVTLGSARGITNASGVVSLSNVPVGEYELKVAKKYYESTDTNYVVPIFAAPTAISLNVAATGRQVKINLTDIITNAPTVKARIIVQDTSATTDTKGDAVVVLPADKKTLKDTVKLDGYNQTSVEVKVTDQADANRFSMTPSGSIYYLSKQTGRINIMKSNLDGTNAQVVVEGTGNENDKTTVLLAARDWRYLAFSANRNGDEKAELYLVDSASGKLITIDEGDAYFNPIGWSDHKFLYSLNANNKQIWEPRQQRIKSFNAETSKLTVIDETTAVGNNQYDAQYEQLTDPYILEGKLIYGKTWISNSGFPSLSGDQKSTIVVADLNNSDKRQVQEFTAQRSTSIQAKLYEPQEVYFRVIMDSASNPSYFEYEGGSVKSITNTDDRFFNTFYPTYLISPSGEKTFWYEPRDGKNALFVGDESGKNATELARQSEYTAYGWYSDKYILLSKDGSELYIAPSNKALTQRPVKITNYHKPALSYPGYGYGYGYGGN
jgi:hypothetical protein